MGIEVECSVIADGRCLDVKTMLADVGDSLELPNVHGVFTTDLYQAELVTSPSTSVARLVCSLEELVSVACDYLDVSPSQVEYNAYETRLLDPEYVLNHPHQHPRVKAQLDALRQESRGRLTEDALISLARACSTHFHLGFKDADGKTLPMSDPERREIALVFLGVFGNAGPYMADWFARTCNIRDDVGRKALWHRLTTYILCRTPKSGILHLTWEGFARSVCGRGPRLVKMDECGRYAVDLETPAHIDDEVVRKTTWDAARLSCLGTIEIRCFPTAPPREVGIMAEMVMVTAHATLRYLEDRRIDTMKDVEALFTYLYRETGGFVPRRPLRPDEWLHLTLG